MISELTSIHEDEWCGKKQRAIRKELVPSAFSLKLILLTSPIYKYTHNTFAIYVCVFYI